MPPSPEEEALLELGRIWRRTLAQVDRKMLLGFGRLLMEWNARINLTGADSLATLVNHHYPDAFAAAARVPPDQSVADVGSGGGLPAIPFGILRPDCSLVLMEPTAKKVAFLRTVVRELGLRKVSILPERYGGHGAGPPQPPDPADWTDSGTALTPPPEIEFDVAMSRATFPPAEWLAQGAKLIHSGGLVIAFASTPAADVTPVPDRLELVDETRYSLLDGGRRWLLRYKLA